MLDTQEIRSDLLASSRFGGGSLFVWNLGGSIRGRGELRQALRVASWPLLNASASDVLQLSSNAQNVSMHVWRYLSLGGTGPPNGSLDKRDDRLPDVLGKVRPRGNNRVKAGPQRTWDAVRGTCWRTCQRLAEL